MTGINGNIDSPERRGHMKRSEEKSSKLSLCYFMAKLKSSSEVCKFREQSRKNGKVTSRHFGVVRVQSRTPVP